MYQFEEAAKRLSNLFLPQLQVDDLQLLYTSNQSQTPIRSINVSSFHYDFSIFQATHVNKLVRVPGIVISASRSRAYARKIFYRCSRCNTDGGPLYVSPMRKVSLPRQCPRYIHSFHRIIQQSSKSR